MAEFKCKNCGHTFEHFCDCEGDAKHVQCPKCASKWTDIIYENKERVNLFPVLPYTDPFYPVPNIDPFPPRPSPYRIWYGTSRSDW